MSTKGARRWVEFAALAAAVAAAAFGLARLFELAPDLTNRLRDDAFYEFVWAANIASGRGPTVSDGVTTSGVQILWSLCLVPFAWVFGPGALPTLAPWLGFLLHAATAALFVFASRDRVTGLCVGLCWLGNPLLVRECQNGQETALACACLALLWFGRRSTEGRFVLLSVLAVLARSDLLACVLGLSLWRHGLRNWRAVTAPALAFAVHVVCNLALGGGWLQDSGLPMAWLWHANHEVVDGTFGGWLARSWWFARPVLLGGPWAAASAMGLGFATFVVLRAFWPSNLRAVPALAVGGAAASGVHDLATAGWTALLLALMPAPRRRRVPMALTLLLCGGAAILVLHWAVRWYPRDYYAAPLVVVAAAAVHRYGRWRVLLVTWALAQVLDGGRVRPETLAGQRELAMAGRFLSEVLPVEERVGCFNSGIVTFFADTVAPSDRRGIVNLDGCVDARPFAALRQARLGAWLDEQGVRFVLDNQVQFSLDASLPHACGRWFGKGFDPARDLREIARFDVPGVDAARPDTDNFRLYRFNRWTVWRSPPIRGAPVVMQRTARDLGPGPDGGRYVLWPAAAGQVLEAEAADGRRVAVSTTDADTTVVLLVVREKIGVGRFYVRGAAEPVLELPRL